MARKKVTRKSKGLARRAKAAGRKVAREGGKNVAGGSSASSKPVTDDTSFGDRLFNALARAGFQARFGLSPEEKTEFDLSGVGSGTAPQVLAATGVSPLDKRASSAFLGTQRFGPFLPALFGELRQQFNVGGGDPDNEAFRNALIEGASRAIELENLEGKAQPERDEFAMGGRVRAQSGGVLTKTLSGIPPGFLSQSSSQSSVDGPGEPLGGFFNSGQFLDSGRKDLNLADEAAMQRGRIGDIQANTAVPDSIVRDLRNFQAGGAGLVSDLRNFDPFSEGRGTLREGLDTGFRQDVGGLTEAAKIRAGQEFDAAQDRIGERLSNLGLTSSSAARAQVGRERGRAAERVAATGLEAEVGANEAAANRRLQALSAQLQGSGQRAGALGSALSGAIARSGQRLSGQQSALGGALDSSRQHTGAATARAGAGQGFLSTIGSPGFGRQSLGPQSGRSSALSSRRGLTGPTSFNPIRGGRTLGIGRPPSFRRDGSIDQFGSGSFAGQTTASGGPGGTFFSRRGFARGGQVRPEVDSRFEGFLDSFGADLLAGNRGRGTIDSGDAGKAARRMQALAALGGVERARQIFEDPDLRASLASGAMESLSGGRFGVGITKPRNRAQATALGFGQKTSPAEIQGSLGGREGAELRAELGISPDAFIGNAADFSRTLRAQNPTALGLEDPTALRNQQFLIPQEDEQPRQRAQGGGVPQPELPQELGTQVPGLLDPRRQFFEEGGGVAPGEDTGEDQVPALLRSEELVVTPELVEELENADPRIPQPQLLSALQQLAKKPLEFSEAEGEFVAQTGGRGPQAILAPGAQFVPGAQGAPIDPRGFDPLLEFFQGFDAPEAVIDPATGLPTSAAPPVPVPPDPSLGGGSFALPEQLPEGPVDFGATGITPSQVDPFNIPGGLESSFSEGVGDAGERSFQLTGSPGVAGLEAGLGRKLRGGVTGSTITTPDGTPLRDTLPQQTRIEKAQRRADLLRAAVNTDPVGSPEKSARLMASLQAAEREVDGAVQELVAAEELGVRRQTAQAQTVSAQANLNESVARGLQAQAQKATAEAGLAKQMLEAAAADPFLAQVLNAFEVQAKVADASPEVAAQLDAVIRRLFESRGVSLTENGRIARLFGAPEFEVEPIQPEVGQEAGQGEAAAGGVSLGQITPEQLAILQKFGAGI